MATQTDDRSSSDLVWVGLDGSPGGDAALRWASVTAPGWSCRVQPLAVSEVLGSHSPAFGDTAAAASTGLTAAERRTAEQAIARLGEAGDSDSVLEPVVEMGSAAESLVGYSRSGAALVVGSRSHGGIKRLLLGSVSAECVNRSTVPVIVVPIDWSRDVRRIVVGVDGSESSNRAVDWVAERFPDAFTDVVHVWELPPGGEVIMGAELHSSAQDACEVAESAAVRMKSAGARAEAQTVIGDTVSALRGAARSSDLLVVGASGRSGLSTTLLGTVATSITRQPEVPTAVIRG